MEPKGGFFCLVDSSLILKSQICPPFADSWWHSFKTINFQHIRVTGTNKFSPFFHGFHVSRRNSIKKMNTAMWQSFRLGAVFIFCHGSGVGGSKWWKIIMSGISVAVCMISYRVPFLDKICKQWRLKKMLESKVLDSCTAEHVRTVGLPRSYLEICQVAISKQFFVEKA